jgi:hypothetical protein
MARLVEKVATPASENQIVSAIVSAWREVIGGRPTLGQVGKTYSQIAIETAHGQAIFNNNVGNINHIPGSNGDYYQTKDSLTVGNNPANRKVYTAKMRSYGSLSEGVSDYLTFLKNRGAVMSALQKGSPQDFSYALAGVGYYDAHIRDDYMGKDGKKISGYTSGLTSIYKQFVQQHRKGGQQNTSPTASANYKPEQQDQGMLASFFNKIERMVDGLLGNASVESRINKYGSKYPLNKYLISVDSGSDLSSKLEFARIFSLAAKEELDANTNTYTDGANVEVQCVLAVEQNRGLDVIKELAAAISSTFEYATKKVGGIEIYTFVKANVNPTYQTLSIKLSEINYRKFHLKFVKGK